MADYTDIDKRLNRITSKAKRLADERGAPTYSEVSDAFTMLAQDVPWLVAELVGLRTEVDQLRGENERLNGLIAAIRIPIEPGS